MHTDTVRHAVAAVGALVVAAGVLLWLNGAAPGLTTGVWMRDTLAQVGVGSSQYEAASGSWLAVRGLLGLYVTGVTATVAVLLGLSLVSHDGGVSR
jgi:hypothetical protein